MTRRPYLVHVTDSPDEPLPPPGGWRRLYAASLGDAATRAVDKSRPRWVHVFVAVDAPDNLHDNGAPRCALRYDVFVPVPAQVARTPGLHLEPAGACREAAP